VAEDEGTQWAHAEARAESGQACQELRGLVALGKEEATEEDGQAAVEIEVVPLEESAQRCREDDAMKGRCAGRRRGARHGVALELSSSPVDTSLLRCGEGGGEQ
jgi:hypothetical protein